MLEKAPSEINLLRAFIFILSLICLPFFHTLKNISPHITAKIISISIIIRIFTQYFI